jgi:8-oxo-dGTP diphosphatase
VYYGKNALGAALAITSDDGTEILLVQRAHEPFKGWWMLPSGYVEYGECATDTAVREAQEEVGLEVELTGLQGLYFGADDPRDVAHLAVYRARVLGGHLRAGDDAAAARFFKRPELPTNIAFEAQRQALADWKRPAAAGEHTPCGPQPPGGADSAERSAP